jgi:hypothetical protein
MSNLEVVPAESQLMMLKDGLSGEYCWYATVYSHTAITIMRRSAPDE